MRRRWVITGPRPSLFGPEESADKESPPHLTVWHPMPETIYPPCLLPLRFSPYEMTVDTFMVAVVDKMWADVRANLHLQASLLAMQARAGGRSTLSSEMPPNCGSAPSACTVVWPRGSRGRSSRAIRDRRTGASLHGFFTDQESGEAARRLPEQSEAHSAVINSDEEMYEASLRDSLRTPRSSFTESVRSGLWAVAEYRRYTLEALLIRESDAMRMLGLKRTKFRAEVNAGRITTVKIGSARLFPVDGLRDYVRRLVAAAEHGAGPPSVPGTRRERPGIGARRAAAIGLGSALAHLAR